MKLRLSTLIHSVGRENIKDAYSNSCIYKLAYRYDGGKKLIGVNKG